MKSLRLTTTQLGCFALLGAPFLGINTYLHVQFQPGQTPVYTTTSLSGFFDVLYVTGWLCSIVALRRLRATGTNRFGRLMPRIMLVALSLADGWSLYEMVLPNHDTWLYYTLDLFWPISNVLMIGYGIAVLRAGRLSGWKRYIPLICGLWLPLTMVSGVLPDGWGFHVSNAYTILSWMLLAIIVLTSRESKPVQPVPVGV